MRNKKHAFKSIHYLSISILFLLFANGLSSKDSNSQVYLNSRNTLFDSDESVSYSGCPDNNHPHAIDLGIGVKWACCNVGASAPEQYGNYYAWGETRVKKYYWWQTYQYYNYNSNSFVFIGNNIAGTKYDAAKVKWGGSWKMPTIDQIRTLVNKCKTERITINGVKGLQFIGPNGASVFFPYAGHYETDGRINPGSQGLYWSSTSTPNNYNKIFYLGCSYYRAFEGDGVTRYMGLPIRPVTY